MYKLKDIWRRYNIAIILIAHYKKLGKDNKPNDESFKDSMAITHVANKVIHLYRDKLNEDWFTDVIITKNRENPYWTWVLELNFDKDDWEYTNIKSKKQLDRETNVWF
jgi:replicative DNA helicase